MHEHTLTGAGAAAADREGNRIASGLPRGLYDEVGTRPVLAQLEAVAEARRERAAWDLTYEPRHARMH